MTEIIRPNRRLITPSDLRVRNGLIVGGFFTGKIFRPDHGIFRQIDEFEFPNLVVNQGLDAILGVMFTSVGQITSWYLAPFKGNYTPVSSDTASSIVSNSTESSDYTASTRQSFTGVEGSQQVTNSASAATFTFNTVETIYGAFLTSISTKQSTSGTLFSAGAFSASKPVADGDVLNLTYTLGASSS